MRRKIFVLLHKKDPERYHYFLWFKFVLLNVFGVALAILAFFEGWFSDFFFKTTDKGWLEVLISTNLQTRFILVMFLTFLFGLLLSFCKVYTTSREINAIKQPNPPSSSYIGEYLERTKKCDDGTRRNIHGLLRSKIVSRTHIIRWLSNTLMMLGLIGTVIGFIIALGGIDPQAASDINKISSMVVTLIQGMAFALYTTVLGAILGGLWLRWNFNILVGGSEDLLRLMGERGEEEAHTLSSSDEER